MNVTPAVADVDEILTHTALGPTGRARITDDVPTTLPDAVCRRPVLEVSGRQGLVRVPGVGRYLVTARRPARVSPGPGATPADVACFLDTPVRALDLLLNGLFALRATAVRIGEDAVAICGQPSVGKSTLGAELGRRGHPVLADAVLPVTNTDTSLTAWPTSGGVELWPPTAGELGVADRPSTEVRPALAKRRYVIGPEPAALRPLPLRAVVVLAVDRTAAEVVASPFVDGRTGLQLALGCIWHAPLVGPLGRQLPHFEWAAALADRATRLRLVRPPDGFTVAALADALEDQLR